MNFLSNVVIILVFIICNTNCLPITKYYFEDYCQEFSYISPNHSNPVTLYLTRKKPIRFEHNFCGLTVNTTDNFYLEMWGHLGQLMVDKSRSDGRSIQFVFNSKITENQDFSEKFYTNEVYVFIENNEIEIYNQTNDNIMDTELEFRAIFKQESYDCDESNEQCQNTEEEIEDSSGEFPLKEYDCPNNDCSGESFTDCEDYETNCTSDSTEKQKRNEQKISLVSELNPISASGSNGLDVNHLAVILCSLFWFRLI